MYIDNFYFVVDNIKKSVAFYSELFERSLLLLQATDGLTGKLKMVRCILE